MSYDIERVTAIKLVDIILSKGLEIALEAEGEPFLDATRDMVDIAKHIDASDFITVDLGQGVGWFLLIWGNGEDIVSDYADNPICNEIYKELTDA